MQEKVLEKVVVVPNIAEKIVLPSVKEKVVGGVYPTIPTVYPDRTSVYNSDTSTVPVPANENVKNVQEFRYEEDDSYIKHGPTDQHQHIKHWNRY